MKLLVQRFLASHLLLAASAGTVSSGAWTAPKYGFCDFNCYYSNDTFDKI